MRESRARIWLRKSFFVVFVFKSNGITVEIRLDVGTQIKKIEKKKTNNKVTKMTAWFSQDALHSAFLYSEGKTKQGLKDSDHCLNLCLVCSEEGPSKDHNEDFV